MTACLKSQVSRQKLRKRFPQPAHLVKAVDHRPEAGPRRRVHVLRGNLLEPVPRSVYLIAPILLAAAMCGSRLAYRAWREGRITSLLTKPQANPAMTYDSTIAGPA